MGVLSRETRALIDAALERIPVETRRVPAGASAFKDAYVWRDGALRARDPEAMSWRGQFYGLNGRTGRRSQRAPWSLSEAKRARIRADVEGGMSRAAAARAHGVSHGVVTAACGGPAARRAEPVDHAAILALIGRGLIAKDIAARCSCSIATVRRCARLHGRTLASGHTGGLRGADLSDAIVALADGRRSISQIARALGVDHKTVAARRDDLSLDIPIGRIGRPGARKGVTHDGQYILGRAPATARAA